MSTRKASKPSPLTCKRRLLALADFLESVEEDQFDYSVFGTISNPNLGRGTDVLKCASTCGTSACALGWAPSLPFAKKLGFKLEKTGDQGTHAVCFTKNGCIVGGMMVGRELFGVEGDAYSFLFYPRHQLGELESPGDRATAAEVADHIRNYVAIRFAT